MYNIERLINYTTFLQSNVDTYNNGPESYSIAGQLLYVAFILILMIAMIYWASRFASKNKLYNPSRNIKILERTNLGVGSYLAIVEVGEKYFLISVSKERTTLISELNKKDVDFTDSSTTPFSSYLKQITNKNNVGDSFDETNK